MEQKGRCIICHTDNSELSDEHVFPDAIGGGYHIYTVCKKCNSFLGEAVDNPLTDHIIIKLFREDYKLAGKTGKIPSFLLDSEIQNKDNPEEKMKFYIDENNELKLKYLPNTKEVIDENGNTKFEVKVDYSDKDRLAKIQEKKIDRYQKKGFSANLSKPEIVSQKGMTIQSELKFDLLKYRIGLLKIAYESMCDFFPEYENDIYGLQISDILRKARYEDVNNFVNIGNGFEDNELFRIIKIFPVDLSNKHTIFFIFFEQAGLYCFISLFDTIKVGVKMSDKNYIGYGSVIFITNDYVTKSIEKYSFTQKTRLQKL